MVRTASSHRGMAKLDNRQLDGLYLLELIFGERKSSIFDKLLPERKQDNSDIEDLDAKLERTFARIKRKAVERETRKEEILVGIRS
jgi:predicted nucleic acid-binding protein